MAGNMETCSQPFLFNMIACAILGMMKNINLIQTVTFDHVPGQPLSGGRVAHPDQHHLGSIDTSKGNLWYHATKNPNWLREVSENNTPVHLGSKKSAFDRMELLSNYTSGDDRWFIYAVWLTEEASIATHYVEDMLDDWATSVYADNGMSDDEYFDTSLFNSPVAVKDKDFKKITGDNDFVRYVNQHENPGHISLFGDPKELELACVFELDREDGVLFELDVVDLDDQLEYNYEDFLQVDLDGLLGSYKI